MGWLKKDGEAVKAGEPLFTLEGDKASQEVEAADSGILRIPPDAPKAGDSVSVGAVLGYLLEGKDDSLPTESLPRTETKVAGREPPTCRSATRSTTGARPG